MATQFPWLDQKYVAEIEARTQNIPEQFKAQAQQLMYSDYYQKQKMEQDQAQRQEYKNQIMQKTISSNNSNDKTVQNANLKLANLADMIRSKYHIDLTAWDDQKVVNDFVDQLPQWNKFLLDYLNWKNSNLLTRSWLVKNDTFNKLVSLNEKNNTVSMDTNVDNAVTEAQKKPEQTTLKSSSHFDDDNFASNFLAQQWPEYTDFIEWARNAWYIDWEIASIINAKQTYERLKKEEEIRWKEYEDRPLPDRFEEFFIWSFQKIANKWAGLYNNLLANNPSIWLTHTHNIDMNKIQFEDDLLWVWNNYGDLRASSKWNQSGEFVGGLIFDIALMKMLPEIGGSADFSVQSTLDAASEMGWRWLVKEVWQRTIIGGAEWAGFWLISSASEENVTPEQIRQNIEWGALAGATLWAIGWGINVWKAYRSSLSDILEESQKKTLLKWLQESYNKAIRPTSRGMKSTTDLQKYNNDAIDSVELIIKNKNNLKFIDANGEEIVWELPRTVDEFSQAIKQTKQNVYDTYIQMAKAAWKDAKVDTTKIVDELKALKWDKERMAGQSEATKNEIDKWINALEGLDNKMSMNGALQKNQELNNELTAFFKSNNPNDVWPNSIKAVVNNGLKRGVDDAIENAWLDSVDYLNLKRAYGSLRAIESDVSHRAVVYGRQNPESLVDSLSNLNSVNAISDFLKDPKGSTLKLIWSQIEKFSARSRNNPNNLVKDMFSRAEKTINKTSTLKTASQQQAQASADATTRQKININRARQDRLNQREWLRNRLESIKAENETRYQNYKKTYSERIPRDEIKMRVDETEATMPWIANTKSEIADVVSMSTEKMKTPEELIATKKWRSKGDDLTTAQENFKRAVNESRRRWWKYSYDYLEELQPKIEEADKNFWIFLDTVAEKSGWRPIHADLKNSVWEWDTRLLDKAAGKKNWINDVTDISRWTLLVDGEEWMQRAEEYILNWAKENNLSLDDIKWDNKFKNPTDLWYKDMSMLVPDKNWIRSELQISNPSLMVAKQGRQLVKDGIMSEAEYNAIVERVGIEWGEWHKFYEQWRDLEKEWKRTNNPEIKKEMDNIAQKSRDYYAKFQ